MADYSIGPFEFLTMTGPPPGLRQEAQVETRPGVDGAALWQLGLRGRPFVCETFRDFETLSDARVAWKEYEAAVFATEPADLVWDGDAEFFPYVIMDVQPITCRAIMGGIGGLTDSPGAILAARWTLLPWLLIND